MKRKLLTVALATFTVIGLNAQSQLTDQKLILHGKETNVKKTLNRNIPLRDSFLNPASQIDDSNIKKSKDHQPVNDKPQLPTAYTSDQQNDEWYEGFENGNLGNFKVLNGGDRRTFFHVKNGGNRKPGCVAIVTTKNEAHNDLLITPAIKVVKGSFLSFFAKRAYNGHLEKFDVVISESGTLPTDFKAYLRRNITPKDIYQKYDFDLSKYAGKTVYVGIYVTTKNKSAIFLDDFQFENLLSHNLEVTQILTQFVEKGRKTEPKVVVYNNGFNKENTWKITLTDGKNYNKSINNPKELTPKEQFTLKFPEWKPADGTHTLTAKVELVSDKKTDNNSKSQKVRVYKPTYQREILYAYNISDETKPKNWKDHIVAVNRQNATLSDIRATPLSDIYSGDFVGDFQNAKLIGVSGKNNNAYLINGSGETHFYKKITGNIDGAIHGFTWDKSQNTAYIMASRGIISKLYKLDENFKAELVGKITDGSIVSIACDANGDMFALSINDDKLYKVDKSNGRGTAVGKLGLNIRYVQDMAFDRSTNTLYGTLFKSSLQGLSGGLYTIDLNTGKATLIGEEFKDQLTLLGTFGNIPAAKDMSVKFISSFFVRANNSETPKVTVHNNGTEDQATWSIELSDGKGYKRKLDNKGAPLKAKSSRIITFPSWTPTSHGYYTLTAKVTLAGDAYTTNNVITKKVKVADLEYKRERIYAFDLDDRSSPGVDNWSNHLVSVDKQTAKLSSIKKTTLKNVFTGDFVGSFEQGKIIGITNDNNVAHVINGNGDTFHYKNISNVPEKINGFTWDQSANKTTYYVTTYTYISKIAYSKLYRLDENLNGEFVGNIDISPASSKGINVIIAIASNSKGEIYGIGLDDYLYSINKTTGKGTKIGKGLGIDISFAQDISFDRSADILYGTLYSGGASGGLYTIDIKTGKAKLLGNDFFKDQLIMLGTYGNVSSPKDLSVDELEVENFIASGGSIAPKVVVFNNGTVNQAKWNINLTDGKGYNKSLSPGVIEAKSKKIVTFSDWKPADGNYTLTAKVSLVGDTYTLNDKKSKTVNVVKLKYNKSVIYGYNNEDRSTPKTLTNHLVKIDKITANLSSIKKAKIVNLYTGDFVGNYENTKLISISSVSNKAYIFNGDGNAYFYKRITGLQGQIHGFTWDKSTGDIFVCTIIQSGAMLYKLDENFVGTIIGNFIAGEVLIMSIACDSNGKLYGIGNDHKLYSINKSTGKGTPIGSGLGIKINFAQDLGFDRTNNILYGALVTERGEGGLYKINQTTGKATLVGKAYKDHVILLGIHGEIATTSINTFSFPEQAKPATIDKAKHTISISVKAGTDVTKLKATFTLSDGATAKVGTVAQVSGTTVNDFTKPVTYKVTAEDGKTSQDWVVTVEIEKSNKTDFTAFSFSEQAKPATIDKAKHTISISVKAGTDVTKLKATFALSEGATAKVGTVAQVSSTTVNDFTKPVTYEVTAEDGTTKQKWVVTVKSSSTPTSIDKSLAEKGIAIYPNPSNGIFNVEVNEPFTMEIIDINGRVVVERETLDGVKRVELPNSGVYFIKFINEKTSLTQRIIVSQ